ncbi:MAG: TonB-dependent receptor [Proteobacteria bacterium]|nr:TonB-dependent receptor [Pseudomonadota bacterium]
MAKEKISTLILLTLAVPALSLAAENSDGPATTAALDEVVVTAARVSESVREVSADVMVIDAEEIAASPARDVGELLTEKGLGSVTRYPGELTSLNIRGFKTAPYGNDLKAHVLVLLNGRRAGTGNLAKIMTGNVERIEVIRGPGAVQYGSAAMGGVINVITRQGSGAPSAAVFSKIGSYGYNESGLLVGGEQSGFDFSGSFSRADMDDYDTGSGDRFHNTGYDHIDHYSVNAGYSFLGRHRIGAIFTRYYGNEIGSPGYLTTNDLDNSKDSANHSMDLIYDGASADKVYSWQVHYFTGKDKDTWFDPTESNASGWDDGVPYSNKTDISGAQAQGSMELGAVRLTAGLDWLDYESTSSADPAETDSENYAAFLLGRMKFMQERLIVDGGLRYDSYDLEVVEPAGRSEDDNNIVASAGVVYLLTDALKLRAHYGEAFIMPGADELAADFYSDFGLHYVGNPDLDPESSKTYEAGINYADNGLSAGLSYFYTRYKDKIESVAAGLEQTWENVGKAEIAGFEGELSWDLGTRFGWSFELRPYVNVTYLDRFEDLDNNTDLKYISDGNASYGIYTNDYQGFSARLNFAYTGEQTIEDWETGTFPAPIKSYGGFTVVDLSISKKILDFQENGSFTLSGDVTNLFDKDYAYVKGYPMPGRMLFVTLTYKY